MLVMTHREGEVLEIGPYIRVYIKRVQGNWVRLGIEAPKDVKLNRVRAGTEAAPAGSEQE
jgi:carbon storage regulator CsrA